MTMTTKIPASALAAIFFACFTAHAQTTAFTYQGQLSDSGSTANGIYDLRFAIYDAGTNGSAAGGALTNAATSVSNGVFTVSLDFGNVFDGSARWIELAVRTNGSAGDFTALSPRQQITSAPYAIQALNASNATVAASASSVAATNISGTISDSRLSSNIPLLNASVNTFSGMVQVGTILSGSGNSLTGAYGAVSGGRTNTVTGSEGAIGGGEYNLVSGHGGVICGGLANTNSGAGAMIGGGQQNTVSGVFAVLAGGVNNVSGGYTTTLGGGQQNTVVGDYSTLGGGLANSVSGTYSTIAGGGFNSIGTNVDFATVGGGAANAIASGAKRSTIAGGDINSIGASAAWSTVGGGGYNAVGTSATYATIPGGYSNSVTASYGFAAGRRAAAAHPGAFVWADSTGAGMSSTASNQFLILAGGGVGIGTNNPTSALQVVGTVTATEFSGDGSGLTNVALLNGTNRFSGVAIATNANNQFAGTFTGNGSGLTNTPTSGNYMFAYDTSAQTISTSGSFQTLTFGSVALSAGWVYSGGTFTCSQSGMYLIEYAVTAEDTANAPQLVSFRVLKNSGGISGSQDTTELPNNNQAFSMSKSFIASANSGDTLQVQFEAGSTTVETVPVGVSTVKPSCSVTIVRLQ